MRTIWLIALALAAALAHAQPAGPARIERQADLAAWMRTLLLEKIPGAKIDHDSTALIRLRTPDGHELEIRTDRVWDQCAAAAAQCAGIARDYVDKLLAASRDQSAPITREQLRVVARSEDHARDARRVAARSPGSAPVMRPVARGLWLFVVADLPTALRLVSAADLERLQLTSEEAIELGRRNVARSLQGLASKARRDPQGFYVLTGDDYESSRVLVDEAWTSLAREWKSALAIMVPGSQTLLYAPSSDRGALIAMQREGGVRYHAAERKVSTLMFHWTRAGWTEYRVPSEPKPAAASKLSQVKYLEVLLGTAVALRDDYVDVLDMASLSAMCEPPLQAWLARALAVAYKGERTPPQIFQPYPVYRSEDELGAAVYACVDSMVGRLDARSEFYDPTAFRILALSDAMRASPGIELEKGAPHPRVTVVRRPGPGADAGVRIGDSIVRVDGAPTAGVALWQIQDRLRGEPGTSVTLTMRRSAADAEVIVQREVLGTTVPQLRKAGGGLVHAYAPSLTNGTAVQLVEALNNAALGSKGVILDLRGNPGGLLDEAIASAAAFLQPKDVVVKIEGRKETVVVSASPDDWRYEKARDIQRLSQRLKTIALVILVDENTAAGAEMIAAALQANKRARVIGKTTRGKGTIATIFPIAGLGNSGLMLTTHRWSVADGRVIEGRGVVPDVRVAGDSEDEALKAAERALLEAKGG